MKLLIALSVLVVAASAENPCVQQQTASGAVCVCNATYCDTVPPLAELKHNEYQLYSTSLGRLGFNSKTGTFEGANETDADATVSVRVHTRYQTILGFGGAITDAASINILSMSEKAQDLILRSYFDEDGIQYTFGRVPIGAADFSPRGYSLCDEEDETLEKFALQDEDLKFKIPVLQKAIELRGKENLKLFGSAWSAPIWMKTNDGYNGQGKVQRKYYDAWARYYLKFLEEYKKNGVNFWALTTQNEPNNGLGGSDVPNNGFDYDDMTLFITEYFGPYLKNSSFKDLEIMLHDDQRSMIQALHDALLTNSNVVKYADGVAVHWYADGSTPPEVLLNATSKDKDLYVLATEACIDFHKKDGHNSVDLGNWSRGVTYVNSIVEDLSHNVAGWIEWNLALNGTGEPNWIDYTADAPIIVKPETDEFYKQPMFYTLGHFSKFVVRQSVRLNSTVTGDQVSGLAFERPDGKFAVVINNAGNKSVNVFVRIADYTSMFNLEAYSINTLLYRA